MPIELTAEQISNILLQKEGHPPPPQWGPLRYVEKEMRCISSGHYHRDGDKVIWVKSRGACHSPTNYTVGGIPMCANHAMMEMNLQLYELGVGDRTVTMIFTDDSKECDHNVCNWKAA